MQRSRVDLPEPLGPSTQIDLAAVDLEADPAQHLELAEALADVSRHEHRPTIVGCFRRPRGCGALHRAIQPPPSRSQEARRASPHRLPPRAPRAASSAWSRAISQSTKRASGMVTIRNRIAPSTSAEPLICSVWMSNPTWTTSSAPEDADERGVLHQRDEVVEQRRDHLAHRLGDDHVAHRLTVAHAERARRLGLAPRHRLDPGAVDLGHVGAVGERQPHHAPPERRGLAQPGR